VFIKKNCFFTILLVIDIQNWVIITISSMGHSIILAPRSCISTTCTTRPHTYVYDHDNWLQFDKNIRSLDSQQKLALKQMTLS